MRILLIITILAQMLLGCSSTTEEHNTQYLAVQEVNKGRMYVQKKKFSKAKKHFAKAIALDSDNDEIYRLAGSVAKKTGDYQEALKLYKKAAELNPNDYRAYGNIGFILKKLEYFDEALASFNKVLEINPNEMRAVDDIADIYFKIGDYKSCKQYIQRYETLLLDVDGSLLSEKRKRRIELARNNHASYKKAM